FASSGTPGLPMPDDPPTPDDLPSPHGGGARSSAIPPRRVRAGNPATGNTCRGRISADNRFDACYTSRRGNEKVSDAVISSSSTREPGATSGQNIVIALCRTGFLGCVVRGGSPHRGASS